MPVDEGRLRATADAAVWAEEFMAEFGRRREDIDEGVMIGWFANAMETARRLARNYRRWPADSEVIVLPRGALLEFFGAVALPPWRDEHGATIGEHVDCAPIASRCIEWVEAHDLAGCTDE